MGEQESPEGALRALRRAADERDWNGCRDATGKLLSRLVPPAAFELTLRQVERRLPAFERHQSGVTWPRDLMESLRVARPSDETEARWPAEDDFPGPGANNLTSALEALWQARQLPAGEPRRGETLVDAISGAILAEMIEAWGARHPEQWARWYQLSYEDFDPELGRIQDTLMRAPETARIERAAWLEVADRLAEALGLASPNPIPE